MFTRRIAIIGCGSIGSILARFIEEGKAGDVELEVLYDSDPERARKISEDLTGSVSVAESVEELLEDDSVDLVVESASQGAVVEYSEDILNSGKDLIVLSVGAFSDEEFLEKVKTDATESKSRVYLPSGAILGLDGVQAAELAEIEEAVLTTRKPPETLAKTKFAKENDVDFSSLEEPETVYRGTASAAVKKFPESINVAASLSLAGVGFDRTEVRIVADPSLDQNVHEISIRGDAGEFTTKARNFPCPDNPKTSYLAALSAVRTLKNMTSPVLIGV